MKIISENRKAEEVLENLFLKIKAEKIRVKVTSDRTGLIRAIFKHEVDGVKALRGVLSTCIDLGEDDWLNLEKLERAEYHVPDNLKARLVENDFVIIPNAHRMFFALNKGAGVKNISINQVIAFLSGALSQVLEADELPDINVHTDRETFMQIMQSSVVENLFVSVTRTNDDNNKEAKEAYDNLMKRVRTRKIETKLEAEDPVIGLDTSDGFIVGALEMAEDNGFAKSKLLDPEGKRRVVSTREYPRKFKLLGTEPGMDVNNVVRFIMQTFR